MISGMAGGGIYRKPLPPRPRLRGARQGMKHETVLPAGKQAEAGKGQCGDRQDLSRCSAPAGATAVQRHPSLQRSINRFASPSC